MLFQPLWRQPNGNREERGSRANRHATGGQTICPSLRLNVSQNTTRALVANQMTDIATWLGLVQELLIQEWEVNIQGPSVHHWLGKDMNTQVFWQPGLYIIPTILWEILVLHVTEKFTDHFFQLIQ